MRISPLAPALLAAAALIAGCGSGKEQAKPAPGASTATPTAAAPATAAPASGKAAVKIKDFLYAPNSVTVKKGATVTFENLDQAPHTATVAQGAMKFDTGTIDQGKTKSVTFDRPGTYAYVCLFHPYMKGTITVQG